MENMLGKEMLREYKKPGGTLVKVAKKYRVSIQRVAQVLKKFPVYKEIKAKRIYDNLSKKYKVIRCVECGKLKEKLTSYKKTRFTNFCSRKCYWDWYAKNISVKKCVRCRKVKSLKDFYWSNFKDYKMPKPYCKKCNFKFMIDWRVRNPEQWKKIQTRATENYYRRKFGIK